MNFFDQYELQEHLKVSKEVINELNIKLEAEADDLKEKLSVITHAFNKIDQESSKHYEVIKLYSDTMQ